MEEVYSLVVRPAASCEQAILPRTKRNRLDGRTMKLSVPGHAPVDLPHPAEKTPYRAYDEAVVISLTIVGVVNGIKGWLHDALRIAKRASVWRSR